MILRRTAFLMLISVFLLQPVFCADWPMSRKDSTQRGVADEELKLPLGLAWQYNTVKAPGNPSAPAVVNGVVYFASADRVYAVDAETGTLKWRFPDEQSLPNVVRSSPAVSSGAVYFGCGDGNLYAVSAEDGSFLWAFATGGAVRSSPIISGETVFVGSDDDHLYAVNAETGESIWGPYGFRTRGDIPNAPAASSGVVCFASTDLHIYGAGQPTGKTLWAYRTISAAAKSSPVIVDNTVYIGAGSVIYGLSLRSGLQKLGITLPSPVSGTPAFSERDMYVVCRDKKLYAYTITGRVAKPKWPEPVDLTFTPTCGATVAGDLVFVAGERGVLAAFSTEDGSIKWRYVMAPAWVGGSTNDYTNAASSPVIANGRLYVLTDDGALHCFSSEIADSTAPEVFNVWPAQSMETSGSPPIQFFATVMDLGTGINPDSIQLELNKNRLDHTLDFMTSTISAATEVTQPIKSLPDGRQTVLVRVSDWMGNTTQHEWSFIVNNRLRPRVPPKSTIPATPVSQTRARPTPTPTQQQPVTTREQIPTLPPPIDRIQESRVEGQSNQPEQYGEAYGQPPPRGPFGQPPAPTPEPPMPDPPPPPDMGETPDENGA